MMTRGQQVERAGKKFVTRRTLLSYYGGSKQRLHVLTYLAVNA